MERRWLYKAAIVESSSLKIEEQEEKLRDALQNSTSERNEASLTNYSYVDNLPRVDERPISVEELLDADEVFCTGTAVVISPVGSITYLGKRVSYRDCGCGVGVVSQQLYSNLTNLQMGLVEDKMGWTFDGGNFRPPSINVKDCPASGITSSDLTRKEQQPRRVSSLKQEMKKGNGNFMVSDNMNQNTYWPELCTVPVSLPYPNQDSNFNNHAAIKKLLIKLGGIFSDDHEQPENIDGPNLQCPLDKSSTQQQIYENSTNMMISSLASMNSLNNTCSQFPNTQYDIDRTGMHMLQGINSFPVKLGEMVYRNPQRIDGLECFYGVDMVNGSTGTNSAESTSWGDISSLVYPPMVSNYEGLLALDESRYIGLQ
ncbi:hypothetical protein HHK36_008246 [Tetracentron sinense]|uniref:Uncharacterized protein n=1 Tax=Tetracentron sinense TaxID=13715 RepID=A0A834ZG12_TETSI|nr:hypothetical protein HHK36_008246 [Tetracentron sinense]